MIAKSLLLALALLQALHASASERTVGNGGGLGEMKAIYLVRHLSTYLAPCVDRPSLCRIKESERANFTLAMNAVRQATDESMIIDHDLSGDRAVRIERSPRPVIHISPRALYHGAGRPLATSEIAALLLNAFYHEALPAEDGAWAEVAQRITSSLDETTTTFPASQRPLVLIHQTSIRYEAGRTEVVFLEDEAKTLNLSDFISQVRPSDAESTKSELTFANWRVGQRLSSGSKTQLTLLADAFSAAGPRPDSYVLILELALDREGAVIENSLRVRLLESM